jgi:hypothetical protein
MRAKFIAFSVTNYAVYAQTGEVAHRSQEAKLNAVCADGEPENNGFSKATPIGELRICIDNPAALDFIKPGKSYYLDFAPAD